jgi:hypothetical protein
LLYLVANLHHMDLYWYTGYGMALLVKDSIISFTMEWQQFFLFFLWPLICDINYQVFD